MAFDFTLEGYRDFSEKIIAANGDQATITSVLAEMQDTVIDKIGLLAKQEQDLDGFTAENQRLKAANAELFFRIGTNAQQAADPPLPEDKPPLTVADFLESIKED